MSKITELLLQGIKDNVGKPRFVVLSRDSWDKLRSEPESQEYIWNGYTTEDLTTKFYGIDIAIVKSGTDRQIVEVV